MPAKVPDKMQDNRMVSSAKQSDKGVQRNPERKDNKIGDETVISTVLSSTNTMNTTNTTNATGSGTTSIRLVKEAKPTAETSAGATTAKPVKSLHALRKVLRMRNEKYLVPVTSTSGTAGVEDQKVVLPVGAVSTTISRGAKSSAVQEEARPRMNGAKITVPVQVHVNGAAPRNTALDLKDGGASLVKTQSGYKLIYSLNHVLGNEPVPGTSKEDGNQKSDTLPTSTQNEHKKPGKSVEATKKIKVEVNTQATGKKSKTSTDSQPLTNQSRGKKRKACRCVVCVPDSGKRQKAPSPHQNSSTEPSNLPERNKTVNQTGKALLKFVANR